MRSSKLSPRSTARAIRAATLLLGVTASIACNGAGRGGPMDGGAGRGGAGGGVGGGAGSGRDAAAGDGLAGVGGGSSADAGGTGGRAGCAVAVPSTGGLKPETVCSVDGWCWSRPLPTGNIVSGVWGSAATDVWVTGAIGTVLHFAGGQWSGTTALVDADFGPVHGKNANDVWFAGGLGALAHWNGAAVAVVPTGTPSTFYGLWEASPQDVWLCVGNSTARWNGSELATVSARQYSDCSDIWGTSATDVWFAGHGSVDHWDGTTNSPTYPDPNAIGYPSLWGTSSTNLWAIGSGISSGGVDHGPGTWTVSLSARELLSVRGSGANDVWAVGFGGQAFHYDGASWTPSSTGTSAELTGVYSAGPSSVWLAGGKDGPHPIVLRGDGGSWSSAFGPTSDATVKAIWSAGAGGEAWAADGTPGLQHLAGGTWSTVIPDPAHRVNGVWGAAPNDVWAVGDGGFTAHWDGCAWTRTPSPATQTLIAIDGTAGDDVWAVGELGAVHWNGTAWYGEDTPQGSVKRLAVSGRQQAWLLTTSSIYRSSGGGWIETPHAVFGVVDLFAKSGAVWLSGAGSAGNFASKWSGSTWQDQPLQDTTTLVGAIGGTGPDDVWIAEQRGRMLHHWDGQTWSASRTGAEAEVTLISGSGPGDVWLGGIAGTILHRPR